MGQWAGRDMDAGPLLSFFVAARVSDTRHYRREVEERDSENGALGEYLHGIGNIIRGSKGVDSSVVTRRASVM